MNMLSSEWTTIAILLGTASLLSIFMYVFFCYMKCDIKLHSERDWWLNYICPACIGCHQKKLSKYLFWLLPVDFSFFSFERYLRIHITLLLAADLECLCWFYFDERQSLFYFNELKSLLSFNGVQNLLLCNSSFFLQNFDPSLALQCRIEFSLSLYS